MFVASTVEWGALVFVNLDTLGYFDYALQNQLDLLSSDQRLRLEIVDYRVLISEDMEEIESRVGFSRRQTRSLPFYVSASGCPPEVDDCPEYYEL